MTEAPVARPSRPSVRFTPLDSPEIMKFAQRMKRMSPTIGPANARSMFVSRTKLIRVEAGVRKALLGNCRARIEKRTPMMPWPASFCRDRRPRLRCLLILM